MPASPTPPRFVVCGDDPLAHSLVEELTTRYGAQVTVILPSRDRNHGPDLAAMPGVRLIEAARLDAAAFHAAGLPEAHGLALVDQDDVGNIHAALRAQEMHPKLRLVIRMYHMSLGYGVRRLFPDCAVLSDAAMAAPELVAAALGKVAPSFIRLPGHRTLYVTRRDRVHARDVVCGIAVTGGDGPVDVLPADDRRANLVLAVARRRARTVIDPDRSAPRRGRWRALLVRRRRPVVALSRALLSLIDSKLEVALLILVAIFAGGVAAIAVIDGVTPWQALYVTLLTAADAGDADLAASLARQVTQTAVAVAGLALVPVVTATVVNASVNARLAVALGRLRQPIAGHIIVAGLGDVGTRVIRFLHELGHDVVAIDQSESSRGAELARELDIPLIVGDANREGTLRQASVRTCQALLALSTSDAVNLGAALHARTIRPDLRVVLRLFDNDLAHRVEEAFDIPISRSVSALAAPAFAAALLEREVIGTIAVRRRVLVIAEVPVPVGAELAGQTVADVGAAGQVRVIASTPAGATTPTWAPPPGTPVAAGDRLLVLATRGGLGDLVTRTGGARP